MPVLLCVCVVPEGNRFTLCYMAWDVSGWITQIAFIDALSLRHTFEVTLLRVPLVRYLEGITIPNIPNPVEWDNSCHGERMECKMPACSTLRLCLSNVFTCLCTRWWLQTGSVAILNWRTLVTIPKWFWCTSFVLLIPIHVTSNSISQSLKKSSGESTSFEKEWYLIWTISYTVKYCSSALSRIEVSHDTTL